MTAKRTLINGPVVIAIERHSVVLEFHDGPRSFATKELDGILITEPVGTLDCVVHVPEPGIFAHVPERCTHPALCGNGVRPGRKDLGKDGRLQSCF